MEEKTRMVKVKGQPANILYCTQQDMQMQKRDEVADINRQEHELYIRLKQLQISVAEEEEDVDKVISIKERLER